jgi:hypothetical protein
VGKKPDIGRLLASGNSIHRKGRRPSRVNGRMGENSNAYLQATNNWM